MNTNSDAWTYEWISLNKKIQVDGNEYLVEEHKFANDCVEEPPPINMNYKVMKKIGLVLHWKGCHETSSHECANIKKVTWSIRNESTCRQYSKKEN